jgi:hypothetical protein
MQGKCMGQIDTEPILKIWMDLCDVVGFRWKKEDAYTKHIGIAKSNRTVWHNSSGQRRVVKSRVRFGKQPNYWAKQMEKIIRRLKNDQEMVGK